MTGTKQVEMSGIFKFIQHLGAWLTGLNIYRFFLFIFLYHILVIFQGLDFNDEGFHLAFYQKIFSDPFYVTYAFWGWLSGIVGGGFMKLFPFLGIWGIRFLGAVVSTATIIIAYNLLKQYVHSGYLKVSMIMLSLFINEDAKNLYYNNLSAFFYFLVAYLIFIGLRDNKRWMILAGGFFVGLNIFTRLPNVLGAGLVLAVIYHGFLTGKTIKEVLHRSIVFFVGILTACLFVLTVMQLLHHYESFVESVRMISTTTQNAQKDDGANGAYGIVRLLKVNFDDYRVSLRTLILVMVPIMMVVFINRATRERPQKIKTIVRFLNYGFAVAAFVLAITGWFTMFRLLGLFTAISLMSALVLFDKKANSDYKLLTLIGGFILLVHPFGSSAGIATVIVYSMWISFPVAVDYIINQKRVSVELNVKTAAFENSLKGEVGDIGFHKLIWLFISVVSLGCLYNVVKYPYLCDYHNRWDMRYSVDNKLMKGVFTSRGRVDALDELLLASSKYVKPNDIVLAYDIMPMYHFMTETRSYVRNPCIWFYTTTLFRTELNLAETRESRLPVIVRQLIKTTGEGSSWPEIKPAEEYLLFRRTQDKNKVLNDFIKRHNYKEVWNNGVFAILIPQNNE